MRAQEYRHPETVQQQGPEAAGVYQNRASAQRLEAHEYPVGQPVDVGVHGLRPAPVLSSKMEHHRRPLRVRSDFIRVFDGECRPVSGKGRIAALK